MYQTEISKLYSSRSVLALWRRHKVSLLAIPIFILPTLAWISAPTVSPTVAPGAMWHTPAAKPIWQRFVWDTKLQTLVSAISKDGFATFTDAARSVFAGNQETQSNPADRTFIKPSYQLVGAAVDPVFGPADGGGWLEGFGYDTARGLLRMATGLSFFLMVGLRVWQIVGANSKCLHPVRRAVTSIVLVGGIPASIHLIGTFVMNNFGGIGCGL
jgi:hypothetical protein